MVEYIDNNHQKRPDYENKGSRAFMLGSFCLLRAVFVPRNLIRGLAFAALLVALHTLAHLEGQGFSSASASPLNAGFEHYDRQSSHVGRAYLRASVEKDPDHFLQMTGADVLVLLDQPELTWHEAPTVFWQYTTENCVLDLYMASMNEDVEHAPVVHYEQRSRIQGDLSNSCAREVIKSL